MSLNAQKTREFSPNVLRRIKLRTRLFVTFLIISLVPVITIGIFSYRAYTQSMNEKVKQAALQSIELLNNNMSTQLGIYSDYIGSISVSDTVQNGVASSASSIACTQIPPVLNIGYTPIIFLLTPVRLLLPAPVGTSPTAIFPFQPVLMPIGKLPAAHRADL